MQKIFLLLAMLTSSVAYAQDITTQKVQFNSNKYVDMSNKMPRVDLNRIVIDKKSKLIWKDGHDVAKYTLDIKGVTGTLNLAGSGQVIYQVSSDKQKGRVTVKKTNDVIKISLLLIEEGAPLSIEFEEIAYTIID